MAINRVGGSPYPCYELDDIRVRRQVFIRLFSKMHNLDMSIINNPQNFMDALKGYAYHQERLNDEKSIIDWITSVAKQAGEELLPEWRFRWLKDTPRACYYAWLYTINSDQPGNEQNPSKQILSTASASHDERYNAITSFFDCFPAETRHKIQDLERLKKSWGDTLNTASLDWLDKLNKKDTESCQWAYAYITKFLQERISEGAPNLYRLALENKPVNDNERYQATYALYDILDIRDKKDLKSKLNKALTQRKYRDKTKDLKRLNTYMTETTKSQLDDLCDHYNKNIQDMIKQVIELSYQQLVNDKQKEKEKNE